MNGDHELRAPYGPDHWTKLHELLVETCVIEPFRLTAKQLAAAADHPDYDESWRT